MSNVRVKGLRGLTYEERLKALKLQPLEKRRLRNDLDLTHKIIYNQIDLEETQLFKFSRRPGLRRSSIILLNQTMRTRRRRNSFACTVVSNWNRLALTATSVPEQRAFKKIITLMHLLIHFAHYSIFAPIWSSWALCPFPLNKYIHIYNQWFVFDHSGENNSHLKSKFYAYSKVLSFMFNFSKSKFYAAKLNSREASENT